MVWVDMAWADTAITATTVIMDTTAMTDIMDITAMETNAARRENGAN